MAKRKIVTTAVPLQMSLWLYFSAATHYYVSGRYAVLAGLVPVAGNLLHHGIEMYLKGALCKTMTPRELKNLSHNLPKIWAAFKTQIADSGLVSFDTLISSLHDFEELRYPDSILSKGMAATFGVKRDSNTVATSVVPLPTYELYLEEIDALVDKIFDVAAVDPAPFVVSLNTRARQYLKEGNVQRWAASLIHTPYQPEEGA